MVEQRMHYLIDGCFGEVKLVCDESDKRFMVHHIQRSVAYSVLIANIP